jgi:hypothetical protein
MSKTIRRINCGPVPERGRELSELRRRAIKESKDSS